MNFLQIGEFIGALGLVEFIKWLITYFTHRKHEKQLKETEVDKAKSDVAQSKVAEENSIRDMYEDTLNKMRELDEKRIAEMREDYNARLAELNATNKELHKTIADLSKSNADLHKQSLELLKEGAKKDEIIEDKTTKIRELNELRVEDVRRIGELEGDVQYLDCWKCYREFGEGEDDCDRREPQQNPPLKFKPRKK